MSSPPHARAWTAVLLVLGCASLGVAYLATPQFAETFRELLEPSWVSWNYPADLVAAGKLRQTLLLLAAGCLSVPLAWLLAPSLSAARGYRAALVLVAAAMGTLVVVFGNRQFGAVDQSLAIDVGWRLVRGQLPYRDFLCTLMPGFFLPAKWAFRMLGVSWGSLTALTAAFAVTTFLWQAALLRRLIAPPLVSLAVASALQTLAVLIASFWWYNPITAAAAVTYLLAALVLLREPPRTFALISYTAALVLIAAMKPNVAAILIAGVTAVLLTSKAHRLIVLTCSAIAFAAFNAILWANGVALGDLLTSYLSIAGRGAPSLRSFGDVNLIERAEAATAILFALSPLWFVRARLRALDPRTLALLLLSFLTGVYAMLAHGELKYLDLPFLLLPVALAALTVPGISETGQRWTVTVCLSLLAIAVVLGAMRHRVERIGFGAFFEWRLDPRQSRNAFFHPLHTGPRFHEVTRQVEQLMAEAGSAKVLFGPRMEAFYAATGRESPRGLPPLLWHRGTFHSEGSEEELIGRFRRGEYDVLVFLYGDFTAFPKPLREVLSAQYVLSGRHEKQFPELTVLFNASRYAVPSEPPARTGDEVARRFRRARIDRAQP